MPGANVVVAFFDRFVITADPVVASPVAVFSPVPLPASRSPVGATIYPERQQLDALRELVSLGYYRGIINKLDDIEAGQPDSAVFVAGMRSLAKQFQFETMGQQLSQVFDEN